MLKEILTPENNVLAIEVIDGFTEADEQRCEQLFQSKLEHGYNQVNVLVKMDEAKINRSSIKAFMEDVIWQLRNYKKMGRLAIVAHSRILKALVPIDNFFYKLTNKQHLERYFDATQMDEALDFVNTEQIVSQV